MSKKVLSYLRMDSTDDNFQKIFNKHEDAISEIFLNSYNNYYGKEYHKKRIIEGKAIVYLCLFENVLVGASYVKRNLRRGSTAVLENFRRKGIAQKFLKMSLNDFPVQYTIISTNLPHSKKMLSLLGKFGFKMANSLEEIKKIANHECPYLNKFRYYKEFFVFDRKSRRRGINRTYLTFLYTK